jgi:predicted DNA-binding transcriptional regulator AlpA
MAGPERGGPAMTKYLPLKSVSARYGISDRTVDRWIETGELPPATYIRGRRYWPEKLLDERDAVRGTEPA